MNRPKNLLSLLQIYPIKKNTLIFIPKALKELNLVLLINLRQKIQFEYKVKML